MKDCETPGRVDDTHRPGWCVRAHGSGLHLLEGAGVRILLMARGSHAPLPARVIHWQPPATGTVSRSSVATWEVRKTGRLGAAGEMQAGCVNCVPVGCVSCVAPREAICAAALTHHVRALHQNPATCLRTLLTISSTARVRARARSPHALAPKVPRHCKPRTDHAPTAAVHTISVMPPTQSGS